MALNNTLILRQNILADPSWLLILVLDFATALGLDALMVTFGWFYYLEL